MFGAGADDDAIALSRSGIALAYVMGDKNSGAAFIDRALALNPNLATAWLFSGWIRADLCDTETSLRPGDGDAHEPRRSAHVRHAECGCSG